MKKVLGIGNAIVDVISFINNDNLLNELKISKGSMQLIGIDDINKIQNKTKDCKKYKITGGSAANTITGISKLGIETGFIGKTGNDDIGEFFKNDCKKNGIKTTLIHSKLISGQCQVLVSNNGERTMCTYLGAASELSADDINKNMFKGYDYFHIEGYLVQNHALIEKAVKLAKECNVKISIDMASYNIVDENLDFLKTLIKNYVDIVFANEEEARSLTGKDAKEAVIKISEECEIAIVKVGNKGSLIRSNNNQCEIKPIEAKCIDTTGAGDIYASGFIYGLTQNMPLELCGKIGSLTGGKVVEIAGAKINDTTWEEIKTEIKNIKL